MGHKDSVWMGVLVIITIRMSDSVRAHEYTGGMGGGR